MNHGFALYVGTCVLTSKLLAVRCEWCGDTIYDFKPEVPPAGGSGDERTVLAGRAVPGISTIGSAKATEAYSTPPSLRGVA